MTDSNLKGTLPPPVVVTKYETIRVKYTQWGQWYYFVGFKVSLGYRAIRSNDTSCRLIRVWLDGALVFDALNRISVAGVPDFLLGTEDQAEYRDQMVINFPFINLGTDANAKVPAVTAEVWDGVDLTQQAGTLAILAPSAVAHAEYDAVNKRLLQVTTGATGTIFKEIIQDAEQRTVYAPSIDPNAPAAFAPTASSGVMVVSGADGLASVFAFGSNTPLATFGGSAPEEPTFQNFPQFVAVIAQPITFNGGTVTAFAAVLPGDGFGVLLFDGNSLNYGVGVGLIIPSITCMAKGQVRTGYSDILVISANTLAIVTIGSPGSGALSIDDYLGTTEPPIEPNGAITSTLQTIYAPTETLGRVYYSSVDDTYIVTAYTNTGTHAGVVRKISSATTLNADGDALLGAGVVLWESPSFTLDGILDLADATSMTTANIVQGELAIKEFGVASITVVDLADGSLTVLPYDPATITIADDEPYIWDSFMQTIYPLSGGKYLQLNLPGAPSLSVASLITAMAIRAGYAPENILVTGLSDVFIQGYIVGTQTTLAGILTDLATLYGFTFGEVGGNLVAAAVYTDDGLFNVTTIPEDDLAVLQEGNAGSQEKINTQILGDSGLPLTLTVSYIDPDLNYSRNTQTAKRQEQPNPTQGATQQTNLTVPVIEDAATMISLLYRALYSTWASNITHSIRLPRKYLALIPTDGLTFTAFSIGHTVTVISATINADFSISLSVAERQTGLILPTVAAQPYGGQGRPPPAQPVRTVLLDLPDTSPAQTALGRCNLGVALSGFRPGTFNGAKLELGVLSNGQQVVARMQVDTEAPLGTVVGVSAPVNTISVFGTDTDTVLTVAAGAITAFPTATPEQLLDGANLVAVGQHGRWELLQYGDATDNGDGTWSLSRLLRGRFGTEGNIYTTGVGDAFVFYNTLSFMSYPSTDYIDAEQYSYRGVALGGDDTTIPLEVMIPVANSKRPYAPVDASAFFTADGSGDIFLQWKRRERFNAPITDGTGDIPLEYPSRQFNIDIWNSDWSKILRRTAIATFASDALVSYTYAAADQTTDGFSGASINFIAYQIEPEIGRGFGGVFAVDITTPEDVSDLAIEFDGDGAISADLNININHLNATFIGDGELDAALVTALVNLSAEFDGDGDLEATLYSQTTASVAAVNAEVMRKPIPFARVADVGAEVMRRPIPYGRVAAVGAEVMWVPNGGVNMTAAPVVGATTTSTTTSLVLAMPAGIASGDIIFAHIATNNANTITPPTGWTLLKNQSQTQVQCAVFWRTAGASEPSTYTWTIHSSTNSLGTIIRPQQNFANGTFVTASAGSNTAATDHASAAASSGSAYGATYAFMAANLGTTYSSTTTEGVAVQYQAKTSGTVAGTDLAIAAASNYNQIAGMAVQDFTAGNSSAHASVTISFGTSISFV